MYTLVSIWTNPWLVGIAASVIGGAAITGVSALIVNYKRKKEFTRSKNLANRDIVRLLQRFIAESINIPDGVIESLRVSMSRRHGIPIEAIWAEEDILDELVREVMESSFISEKTKSIHAKSLLDIKENLIKMNRLKNSTEPLYLNHLRLGIPSQSILIGLMSTALIGMILTLLQEYGMSDLDVLFALVGVVTGVVVVIAAKLFSSQGFHDEMEKEKLPTFAELVNSSPAYRFFAERKKSESDNEKGE